MKTVVITGVSRGIGKSLAEKFLSENFYVIGTSTTGNADWSHKNLYILKLQLEDSSSINLCVERIFQMNKKIDIVINNAAVIISERTPDGMRININTLRKTLEIDLIGVIDFTLKLLPLINKGGHIVNVSSRMGSKGYITKMHNPSYQIAKAGINMFTKALSFQLKDDVIVSSVHPGAVLTALAAADADMQPEEAARYIYELAVSKPPTGEFWYKGEKFPW